MFAKVVSVVAAVVAGAALAVSLLHLGPAGPRGGPGPRGPAGKAASAGRERLGVCWSAPVFTQTWADGSASYWVSSVTIDPAQITDGVYQCPQGETFTSIMPAPVHS
jgi:hypothetical protein